MPSPLGSAIPGIIRMAALPWSGDVGSAPGDIAFGTWDSTFGTAAPGETARVTALVVWSADRVHGLQVLGELADEAGGARRVASPEPLGVEPQHRREVVLEPGEFVTCINAWTSQAEGAAHENLIGSLSVRRGPAPPGRNGWQRAAVRPSQVTLSSCRVLRFGGSWFPGQQHSPCAPSFSAAIPAGARILGFHGERRGSSLLRLGVVYSEPPPGYAAAAPRPYEAERDALSLAFLRRFYDSQVAPLELQRGGEKLTTDQVAKEVIMRRTWDEGDSRARRFVALAEPEDKWAGPDSGTDMFFCSHAFGNPFSLVVEALEAHFEGAGATPGSVFVWLDVFAINQADPGVDLDEGRTLTKTIDLSAATLVVLDKPEGTRRGAMPLTRLWCLYEIGCTPQDKLLILSHGFEKSDMTAAFRVIDVENAGCFDMSAKEHIQKKIKQEHTSLARFTTLLKLRFLLSPTSYAGDIAALLSRSKDSYDFSSVVSGLEGSTQTAIACICAHSGEGKSTLSAALTRLGGRGDSGAGPWLHAWHFCKHSDARRQDGVMIAKSLCYQLALRFPAFAAAVLELDAAAVAQLQQPEQALEMLVLKPLAAQPAGQRAVVLFDALDEADPQGGATALSNPVVRIVTALHAAGALVVATTRPDPPHIVRALQGRWGGAFLPSSPGEMLKASAAADDTLRADWKGALDRNAGSKIFCTAAAKLLELAPNASPPESLAAAYQAIFAHSADKLAEVAPLLQLLMAAREPPSVAALEQLGVRKDLRALPGVGVLFQERDFHVYSIHKSLAEWLKGMEIDGGTAPLQFAVDVAAGNRAWAAHCKALAATPDAYALRYVLQHLTAARLWAELSAALLDFDFWEHAFRAGTLEFALIEDVAAAEKAAAAEKEAGCARAVAADVLRWLLADGRFMRTDPRAVLQRARAAPSSSEVAKAAGSFDRQPVLRLVNPPAHWPADVMTVDCGAAVVGVCYSPDGDMLLAVAGCDVLILKAATGRLVTTLKGHSSGVICCAWSKKGDLIATGGEVWAPIFRASIKSSWRTGLNPNFFRRIVWSRFGTEPLVRST